MEDEEIKQEDKILKYKMYLDKIKTYTKNIVNLCLENKFISVVVLLAIIIFFISSFITTQVNGKDKLIYDFNKALENRSYYKLKKYMVYNDKPLKHEDIKHILNYIDKHSFYKDLIIDSLTEQKVNDNLKENIFELKNCGKNIFGFYKYKVNINPIYINIKTKYKNTKIYIDDKFYLKTENDNFEKDFGPFIVGNHKVKAIYEDKKYNIFSDEEILANCFSVNKSKIDVRIFPKLEYINIYCNKINTRLYINGVDTNINIGKSLEYGPIPLDGSVNIYTKKGDKKSNLVNIKNNYIIKLNID